MNSFNSELAIAYLEHRDALYRVAGARLASAGLQDEVEDVISSVFVELLEKPPAEEVLNWEAYLVTVVKRRAIDRIRAAEVTHRSGADVEWQEVVDERDEFLELEDGIDVRAKIAIIRGIIESMDLIHQKICNAYFWENRKQADIAFELGLSQGRVSQIIQQIRNAIRDQLKGAEVTK